MITDRAGFHVRRLQQIWSAQIQRCFREAGYEMTAVQFAALELVVDHPGLDQTDLALRIGYDRATTGGVVARLEKMGYLDRAAAPNDRRSRILVPTAAGRAALVELQRLAQDADELVLAPLDGEAREMLCGVLRKVVAAGNRLGVAPEFRPLGKEAEAAQDSASRC